MGFGFHIRSRGRAQYTHKAGSEVMQRVADQDWRHWCDHKLDLIQKDAFISIKMCAYPSGPVYIHILTKSTEKTRSRDLNSSMCILSHPSGCCLTPSLPPYGSCECLEQRLVQDCGEEETRQAYGILEYQKVSQYYKANVQIKFFQQQEYVKGVKEQALACG